MVLIEMAMKRDVNDEPPARQSRIMPRKDSYIWMIGQPWPVPVDEDVYVMRIEAFGPELDWMRENDGATIAPLMSVARQLDMSAPWAVADWLPSDAPLASEIMRARCKR